jgi:hypothetical protein
MSEPTLVDKIVALHLALDQHRLPHAFGGALALAWCTRRPRGTVDVDVNVLVPPGRTAEVLASLPPEVSARPADEAALRDEGQARLWWGRTPVDVFLSTTPFHDQAATRVRVQAFAGHDVPFLGCSDLAVFKAFFGRPKDWVDLSDMQEAGSLDLPRVLGQLVLLLGPEDLRVARLRDLAVT